jgi:hypothetical protein
LTAFYGLGAAIKSATRRSFYRFSIATRLIKAICDSELYLNKAARLESILKLNVQLIEIVSTSKTEQEMRIKSQKLI